MLEITVQHRSSEMFEKRFGGDATAWESTRMHGFKQKACHSGHRRSAEHPTVQGGRRECHSPEVISSSGVQTLPKSNTGANCLSFLWKRALNQFHCKPPTKRESLAR
jgi:hypothetical protein